MGASGRCWGAAIGRGQREATNVQRWCNIKPTARWCRLRRAGPCGHPTPSPHHHHHPTLPRGSSPLWLFSLSRSRSQSSRARQQQHQSTPPHLSVHSLVRFALRKRKKQRREKHSHLLFFCLFPSLPRRRRPSVHHTPTTSHIIIFFSYTQKDQVVATTSHHFNCGPARVRIVFFLSHIRRVRCYYFIIVCTLFRPTPRVRVCVCVNDKVVYSEQFQVVRNLNRKKSDNKKKVAERKEQDGGDDGLLHAFRTRRTSEPAFLAIRDGFPSISAPTAPAPEQWRR